MNYLIERPYQGQTRFFLPAHIGPVFVRVNGTDAVISYQDQDEVVLETPSNSADIVTILFTPAPPNVICKEITDEVITDALGYVPEDEDKKNDPSGYAGLGTDGKVLPQLLPALAIGDVFVAASESEMLALSAAGPGDVCVRTDLNKSFILKASPYSTLVNWTELLSPTDSVLSVNGLQGTVVLTKNEIGLGHVQNKSSAEILAELGSSNVVTALGYTPENLAMKDVPGGYVGLGIDGKFQAAYVPQSIYDAIAAAGSLTYSQLIDALGFTPENLANKNQPGGYAGLGEDGKVLPTLLPPAAALNNTYVVNSQAEMLALSAAVKGDVAIRTDVNKTFILKNSGPSTLSNWQEILTATSGVTSVNGQTGAVVIPAGNDASKLTTGLLPSSRLPSILASVAKVNVKKNGALIGTQNTINLIPGSNVSLDMTETPATGMVNVTINATGGTSGGTGGLPTRPAATDRSIAIFREGGDRWFNMNILAPYSNVVGELDLQTLQYKTLWGPNCSWYGPLQVGGDAPGVIQKGIYLLKGDITLAEVGKGIRFPDGSYQTTAATGGGGGGGGGTITQNPIITIGGSTVGSQRTLNFIAGTNTSITGIENVAQGKVDVTITATGGGGGSGGSYTLPIATSDVLGGVKIGAGLSINSSTGVVSVDATSVSGLSTVARTGAYSDLTGKPALATVATTGSYNDLTDKPTNTGGGVSTGKAIAMSIVFGG